MWMIVSFVVTVDKDEWLSQVPIKGKGEMSLNPIYEKELLAQYMKREEQVLKKCQ